MGIHTGEPVIAENRYVGLDVHRAARICDAGHGGQVLLSNTTHALLEGDLPGRRRAPASSAMRTSRISTGPSTCTSLTWQGSISVFPALNTTGRAAETPIRVVLADDSVLLREGSGADP